MLTIVLRKRVYRLLSYIGLMIIFFQCSETENAYQPSYESKEGDKKIYKEINFFEEDSYLYNSLIENNTSLKYLSDFEVNKDNNSLLLLFRRGTVIELFDDKTMLLINSSGSGPGEMQFATKIKIRNSKIYILDRNLNKILKFDLNGKFIKDIVINSGLSRSFEISEDENIMIVNSIPFGLNPLVHVFDETGKQTDEIGTNKIIQPILEMTEHIPAFLINKNKINDDLVLTSILTGKSFIINLINEKVKAKFSIDNGPEWEAMVRFEKETKINANVNGFFRKIENVDFFSNGDILVSWGGPYKKTRTISVIFDSNGHFKNRIFGNKTLHFRPTLLSIQNDSTFWIYSRNNSFLGKAFIKEIDRY